MSNAEKEDPTLTRLADERSLGRFIASYPPFMDGVKTNGYIALGGLVCIGYAIFAFVAPLDMELWQLGLIVLAGVGFSVWGGMQAMRQLVHKVQTHENGFVYKRLGGVEVVPYAEVRGLHVDVITTRSNDSTSRNGKIHAYLANRRVEVNPNVDHVNRLLDELVERSAVPIVDHALAELQSGRSVDCGPFRLTPDGVETQGQVLPYSDKLRVWHDSSHFSLKEKKGVEFKFRRSKVVNAPYVEAVLRKMSA